MQTIRKLLVLVPIATIVLMASSQAHALTVQIPAWPNPSSSYYVFIGNAEGKAMMVTTNNWGETCNFYPIGNGGLNEDTIINGTGQGDWVIFLQNEERICFKDMTPLVTNGYRTTVNGRGGADILANYTIQRVTLHGGNGIDAIGNLRSNRTYLTTGNAGNDLIFVDSGDAADGNNGSDTFCTMGSGVDRIRGGDQQGTTDKRCGPAANNEVGIEQRYSSCSQCE